MHHAGQNCQWYVFQSTTLSFAELYGTGDRRTNVEQCWNGTEVLGEELMPTPLRLPKILHTTDVIMEIIQGNMIPSETAVVVD